MSRKRIIRLLGGLALLGPVAAPTWAAEKPGSSAIQIYSTRDSAFQAAIQQQPAPEQAVPHSTESKEAAAASTNCEAAEASDGFLMEHLKCHSIGSWLDCCGIKVSGWVDQGFTWNSDKPDNNLNFPQTFNDQANKYTFNQIYLVVEKAVNTEACCWDIGGRLDLLYGTDYYFTTALGLETHQDGTQKWNSEDGNRFQFGPAAMYGLAMPQLYGEVFAPVGNGLSIKFGHFYTTVGYETVTSTGNFFYSHAYTHQYFEPFTHIGVLATYNLNKCWQVHAGITRGWDTWEDNNDNLGFLGGFKWTSPDENSSFFYGVHIGDEPGLLVDDDRFYHSVIFTHKLTDSLTSVTGHDLILQDDGSINNSFEADDAEAYSIYQYLFCDINECLRAGVRFEWSRDDDNLRVIPIGSGGRGANYFSLTTGLNWKLFDNLMLRPELRWDWSNFDVVGFSGAGAYDDFSDKNQFTAAISALLTF